MTFLVDANVLSEPTRLAPNGKVVDWLAANESEFVVDAVIIGELCAGVHRPSRGRKRARLRTGFEAVWRLWSVCLRTRRPVGDGPHS